MTTTRTTYHAIRNTQHATHNTRLASCFLLLAICTLAFTLRAQKITWVGTHRDEGVYISLADQMFHGQVIYRDVVDNKPPGLPWLILGLFRLFGPGIIAPRVTAVLTASLTCLLVFLIGREISGTGVGLLAALFFALDPLSIFWGRFALTEPLMALLEAAALYAFIVGWERRSRWPFVLSGLLIGGAFTAKQPGIVVSGALIAFVALEALRTRPLSKATAQSITPVALLAGGFALAWLPTLLYLGFNHALGDYVTFVFGANRLDWRNLLALPERLAATGQYFLRRPALLMALPGAAIAIARRKNHPFEPLLTLWAVAEYGFLLILQHLEYDWGGFSHYILSAIAPLSLLGAVFVGWAVADFRSLLRLRKSLCLLALIAILALTIRPFWADLRKALWLDYPGSTLEQEARVGQYIQQTTAPDDRILVLANSIFYYWAERRPASRFIHYTWRYGQTRLGEEVVADIERALHDPQTKLVVATNDNLQWLVPPPIKSTLKRDFLIRHILPYDYNFHDQVCFFTRRAADEAPLPVFDSADGLAIQHPLAATFEGEVRLRGVDVDSFTLQPGYPLRLSSYWQVLARTRQDYVIVARLVDDAGTEVGADGGFPLRGRYPTGLWTAGEVFRDDRAIPVPPDLPPGRYRLELELYDLKLARSVPATGSTALPPFKVPQPTVPPSAIAHPLGATFAPGLELAGFRLTPAVVQPGQTVTIELYWRAGERLAEDYTVFVHLTDGQGRVIAQSDSQPDGGRYPTSIWDEGELVEDTHRLTIPPGTPPGEYRLVAGLYLLATMERLPVVGDASGENAVELGTITVTD